jgi:hypothetical protein
VFAWSLAAVKNSLGLIGKALRKTVSRRKRAVSTQPSQ